MKNFFFPSAVSSVSNLIPASAAVEAAAFAAAAFVSLYRRLAKV